MDRVVIYSKPNCSYCNYAKTLLEQKNIPYHELKLDVDFSREQIQELYPTARSFPIVTVDGFYIGGYTQLNEKLNQYSIKTMLTEQVKNDTNYVQS